MAEAPLPQGIHGFLGLAGYYQKFIRDFGSIVAPLTRLLCKDSFDWSPEATEAFAALKRALSLRLVLLMPDFDRPFIIDCDAFGAVLH